MKKLLVAALMSAASVGAYAADVKVTFDGEVVDETCKINGADPLVDVLVTLPKVSATSFSEASRVSGAKKFDLKLTDCTAAPTVRWEPLPNVDLTTGNLKNLSAGGSNVQVQVLDIDQRVVDLNDDTGYKVTLDANNAATVSYYGQYYANTLPATAGLVNTYGFVTLTYDN
ncbi:major type 1 subunit fimbrin (pilin) [Pseudomonas nitritireducens]|uniref:Major type 1 subunit fimbrin (Pilin) n=1 Tax=Pseudomonas nitroreducens TaxID=46680 RepID=A0A7W7P3X8_PSENT|nr:fimbrial protein [Pseudomonas nitritireducens]MBB4866045.1 major type 1 subunit fimbrin (pilin) [Pseudomonas nitritireducens]